MSQYTNIQIEKLTGDAESFASEIETNEIDLDNFQSVKIIVNSGAVDVTNYNFDAGSGEGGGDDGAGGDYSDPDPNEGTNPGEETTIARIIAILDDESEQEIKEQAITVGNYNVSAINLVANEIAHYDAKKIKVRINAIEGSQNTGSVFAILTEARYTE